MNSKNIFILFLIFIISCSLNKEVTHYGNNEKYFSSINIKKNQTPEAYIIKELGPPSFKNPYDNNNVFYVSQKMIRVIGKVNQFETISILEITYDKNRIVKRFSIKEEKGSNKIQLSRMKDENFAGNRKVFEVFKNVLSNLRRGNWI